MRAERFGSYSIVDDRRRNAALVALEVDDAVVPLVPAAAPPGRQLAVVVAAAGAAAAARSAACAARSSDVVERLRRSGTGGPGDVGLYLRIGMIVMPLSPVTCGATLLPGTRDLLAPRSLT